MTPTQDEQAAFDPITFSVMLHRFASIVNEMTVTVEQTAWSSILALCRDLSCAIYDWVPRQISMFDALPIQTTSMDLILRELQTSFDGEIFDGDVFICNDPYRGNTHVGDLVTARPVFVHGEPVFWSVVRGHQLDTGAIVPSSVSAVPRNVWQEGITLPPVKIVDKGVTRRDVLEVYLANVRYRDVLHGDLLAQMGACDKGRLRLIELCLEYGVDVVTQYVDAFIEYGDRRTAVEIEAMPSGQYFGEGWIDGDGHSRSDITVKVAVTIEDSTIAVDFTGSDEQAEGGVNGTFATTQAAGICPILYCIDADIPHNDGCIKRVTVHAPEGTVCNARYPASTSCATILPADVMQEAVGKALASAIPEKVMAGCVRAANIPTFSGVSADTGDDWAVMIFNAAGGGGAARDADGWPLFDSVAAFGGMKFAPVEHLELLWPLRIEEMEIEPESMGFGQWIGGPGARTTIRLLEDSAELVTFGDGYRNPPHGVLGGTPGIGGGHYLEDPTTGQRRFGGSALPRAT